MRNLTFRKKGPYDLTQLTDELRDLLSDALVGLSGSDQHVILHVESDEPLSEDMLGQIEQIILEHLPSGTRPPTLEERVADLEAWVRGVEAGLEQSEKEQEDVQRDTRLPRL